MRIGVDACCWSNQRGYGRFTRELLSALIEIDKKNEYVFFIDQQSVSQGGYPNGVEVMVAPTKVSPTEAASASGRRSIADLWALSRLTYRQKLDLFFFPTVYSYFPILNSAKVVLTIHDMIADHHPERVFPNKKLLFFWKMKQNLAVRQAHTIMTVSDYSKNQIMEFFNLSEERVQTITEGPSSVFKPIPVDQQMDQTLERYLLNASQPFLLYVGGISPHKNLRVLIEAFYQLKKDSSFSGMKLILVGDYQGDSFYSEYPVLTECVKRLHLQDEVVFTGFVEDQDLVSLYNAASALVFPSLEEGFGLPAIEAMACGTPVISSDRGSLPEVLGEAGRFFDPTCVDSLFTVLRDVLQDSRIRDDMRHRGLVRAKQFTWEVGAQKTLSIFNGLVS